jgi:cell wall-associated NlpC family hydrolase
MRAHAWLNRLRAAYRYAYTRERRIQLGRAVRITRARIFRDHVATVRQAREARLARQRPRGMSAVVAFALAQVGDRYRMGATGPNVWDCSGLTRAAYARAGIRLPRVSGAQRARARPIPRSQARPGDLVVGPRHVGIYLGAGMMVDAGNRRVGVVKRKMYRGLSVARVR